jgi:hypothetical protein
VPTVAGPSLRGAARAQGPGCVRSRPGAGGRMSNISAGPVSIQRPSLRLLLAAICKATTNPTTKITKLTKDSQRLLWGHLTHYPILKVHYNLLIAAGPALGLPWRGRAAHPVGPRSRRCRSGSWLACARSCAGGGGRMSNISAGPVSMLCSVCGYYYPPFS